MLYFSFKMIENNILVEQRKFICFTFPLRWLSNNILVGQRKFICFTIPLRWLKNNILLGQRKFIWFTVPLRWLRNNILVGQRKFICSEEKFVICSRSVTNSSIQNNNKNNLHPPLFMTYICSVLIWLIISNFFVISKKCKCNWYILVKREGNVIKNFFFNG